MNKNASFVCEVQFKNGNQTKLFLGTNSNLGTDILWQVCNSQKPARVTGRNIGKLLNELNHCLNEGECWYVGPRSDVLLDKLTRYLED